MRTVLLGPAGQLGSDILAANTRRGDPLAITPVGRSVVDLTDLDAAASVLRDVEFDCLINCASYHKTDEVEDNAQLAFKINAHLVRMLAELCVAKSARFVHISTDYVFGAQSKRTPLNEDDGKAPVNVYGASKAMGEDLALLTGADVLILRVASLFGVAGASGKGGNFVETMIRLAKEKGKLTVVADQVMSPTATADIADTLLTMLVDHAPPGIWNVVNSGAATWYDFARRIVARAVPGATVAPVSSSEYRTAARRPAYSVLDNGKVSAALGPMRPWQEALDRYLLAKGYTIH